MSFSIPTIAELHNESLREELQSVLDGKTKPLGSLGDLESLAVQIGLIQNSAAPTLQAPQMVVFAGDHGLVAHGVSAYPSDVTWQMVENYLAGGAAICVIARQHGLALTVVDCGVNHDFLSEAQPSRPGLIVKKVAKGTADSFVGPAMTLAQCHEAICNGYEVVKALPGNVLLLGEMGIGNTSAAALLLARLAELDIADCAGAGAGLDNVGLDRKIRVLSQVLQRHSYAAGPMAGLTAFGGFEIATMVGAVLQAAHERRVVVVDGFIACAAVMVAQALVPHVLGYCVFAHRSGERGHRLMLEHIGANPLLDLGLRVGEGTGAALAWPLLVSVCQLMAEMASFSAAGVAQAKG